MCQVGLVLAVLGGVEAFDLAEQALHLVMTGTVIEEKLNFVAAGEAGAKLVVDGPEVIEGQVGEALVVKGFAEELANGSSVPGGGSGEWRVASGEWGVASGGWRVASGGGGQLGGEVLEGSVALVGFGVLIAENVEEEDEGVTAVCPLFVGKVGNGGFDAAVDRVAFGQAGAEGINCLVAKEVAQAAVRSEVIIALQESLAQLFEYGGGDAGHGHSFVLMLFVSRAT